MNTNDLFDALSLPDFCAEVHHLFWIKPFVNRGKQDMGWSCRDHSLTLGLVAAMLGREVVLVTGEAHFVQGPSAGRSPVGVQQAPHSWFRTAEGSFDFSWRLDAVRGTPRWRPWHALGIVGGKVRPAGAAAFFSTTDKGRYGQLVNAASHAEDQRYALYWAESVDSLDAALLARQYTWVDSPLTDRLRRVGPNLYSAAALHLLACLEDQRSLRDADQVSAWAALADRYPDALDRTVQRLVSPVPG